MREIAVGIRIHPKDGLSFFGVEQVNALINLGGKVTSIDGGGAVMHKLGEKEGKVQMTLSGCDIKVLVDDSTIEDSPANHEHNRLYQEACDLIRPYMHIVEREHQSAHSEQARLELDRGISLLRDVLKINPANWSAYWVIGKACQALGNSEDACEAFQKSFGLEKGNVDVAREYMFECLNLGQIVKGISAAEHAVKLEPENSGLLANLGLAYFLGEKLEEARKAVEQSLAIAPEDPITQNLHKAIADVQTGKKPQPKSMQDLDEM